MASDKEREQKLLEINHELLGRQLKPVKKLGDVARGEVELLGIKQAPAIERLPAAIRERLEALWAEEKAYLDGAAPAMAPDVVAALADFREREKDVLGSQIKEIYDFAAQWFTIVRFDAAFAAGKTGVQNMILNANGAKAAGVVLAVLVNDRYFALVKQWRATMGRWMIETPRGFTDKLDAAKISGDLGSVQLGDIPFGALQRELGEEVMRSAKLTQVVYLGNRAQNTGTDTATPPRFLVKLKVPDELLTAKFKGSETLQDIKVFLWDMMRVEAEMGAGGAIEDDLTVSCMQAALAFIESMSKMQKKPY